MRLHHAALRTDDVDGLAAFYVAHFGLVERRRDARSVWLGLEGGAVLMIERREPGEPRVPEGSREFVAFAVGDEAQAALRVRLVAEGRLEAETDYTLYFRDPDGRRVGTSRYDFG